ncbi:hypothetical protein N2152v2_008916 [Parachlorella kessleri]
MVATFSVDPEYGFVLASAAFSILVVARKQYKVFYPALYADKAHNKDADAFNCVQRGHQNTLENFPAFLGLLLATGLRFPIYATLAGLVWTVGRIVYFKGYSTGDPKARYRGGFCHFGLLGLLVLSVAWAIELLKARF